MDVKDDNENKKAIKYFSRVVIILIGILYVCIFFMFLLGEKMQMVDTITLIVSAIVLFITMILEFRNKEENHVIIEKLDDQNLKLQKIMDTLKIE